VRPDKLRVKRYFTEIRKNSLDLNSLIDSKELLPGSIPLKAAKYILIELAEAMSNTIQHILAKDKGIAVSGYIDTILKAYENGLVSENLFQRLKPFFDFRNSLIHRYWTISDERLVKNILQGRKDFDLFIEEIEAYLKSLDESDQDVKTEQ
jgi:uncharacterized protein YutE (UPF0331/DUF86 family)